MVSSPCKYIPCLLLQLKTNTADLVLLEIVDTPCNQFLWVLLAAMLFLIPSLILAVNMWPPTHQTQLHAVGILLKGLVVGSLCDGSMLHVPIAVPLLISRSIQYHPHVAHLNIL